MWGAGDAPSPEAPAAVESTPAPGGDTTASGEAEQDPAAPTEDLVTGFGSTIDWGAGVSLTLSVPEVVEPTEAMASGEVEAERTEFVVLEGTMFNGADIPLPPLFIRLSATSGDVEAPEVFDVAQRITRTPVEVLPGMAFTTRYAFARVPGEEFVVTAVRADDPMGAKRQFSEALPAQPAEPVVPDGTGDGFSQDFGTTVTWDDGLEMTAAEPVVVERTDQMDLLMKHDDWEEFVAIEVTVSNGSDEAKSAPFLMAITGQIEAEQIYDRSQNIDGLTDELLPGESVTATIGFARLANQEFVLIAANLAEDFSAENRFYRMPA